MQAEEERLQAAEEAAVVVANKARAASFAVHSSSADEIESVADSGDYDDDKTMGHSRRSTTTMVVKGARNALVEWKKTTRRATSVLDCASVRSADCVLVCDTVMSTADRTKQASIIYLFYYLL